MVPSAKRAQVFVSYAQNDVSAAAEISTFLEQAAIPCWMAARSIPPGVQWADAIVDAMEECQVLLALLSPSSNASENVARELALAADNRVRAIPVRLEDCLPTKGMKFFLGNRQYLDAHPSPLAEYRHAIVEAVRGLLGAVAEAKPVITPRALPEEAVEPSADIAPLALPEAAVLPAAHEKPVKTAIEIIGVDFGHGETAVAKVSIHHNAHPTAVTVQGKTSQITALGYHPRRGFVIGDEALLDPEVEAVLVCFKQRPAADPTYPEIVADYLRAYYRMLLDDGSIRGAEESHFFIGCPSGWSRDEMSIYETMLKRSGIPRLTVVKESRAALLNVIESGGVTTEELRSTILIIDLGSSTTDFTVVTGGTSEAPMDFGQSLGASFIDKEILRHSLERHPQSLELRRAFESDPSLQERCEVRCRKAKEEYFSKENIYRDNDRQVASSFETLEGGILFIPYVTGRVMNRILNEPISSLGGSSWIETFRQLLLQCQEEMGQQALAPGVIVATGGASRMGFVRPICEEVFRDSKFRRDDEPEVSVARGLARWGRVYLRTADFESEVVEITDRQIPEIVLGGCEALAKELATGLCQGLFENSVRPALIAWRAAEIPTLGDMGVRIEAEAQGWFCGAEAGDLIAQAVERWFQPLEPAVIELTDPLCKKYSLPRASLRITPDFRGVWNPHIDSTQSASSIGDSIAELVLTAMLVAMGAGLYLIGPGGWLVMGALSVKKTYDDMTQRAKTMNVWKSAREFVLSDDKMRQLLENMRAKVEVAIRQELESGAAMREMARSISLQLKSALQERADEARLLIS
jgi:hypothetical protein